MIYGFSDFGYEGSLVEIETDLRNGIPAIDIVGLSDGIVKETRERMKSAIKNSGFIFPNERVLISLPPADLKKDGASFDLPITLSVLTKSVMDKINDVLVMGELDLAGNVRPVKGTFAACQGAIDRKIKYAILPDGSSIPNGIKVCFVKNLKEAFDAFISFENETFKEVQNEFSNEIKFSDEIFDDEISLDKINNDFSNDLKFAMTVAVAGKHNLLVIGQPGCSKTSMLQKLPQILPQLSLEESQSTTRIHSLAGLVKPNENYMTKRPFRLPHQTASIEGLCGGGPNCRPGEISLAHNGILFFDEASEFKTSCLQMLRVPMEKHSITLSRAGRTTCYPSDFQLVMATSPCPCGNYGNKDKICLCSQKTMELYWKKFSSPLLDRMEIRFNCNSTEQLANDKMTVSKMRELITNAWTMQKKRNFFNGRAKGDFIGDFENKNDGEELTHISCINSRKVIQIVNLARTLSDMRKSEKISHEDFITAKKLRATIDFVE